MISTRYIFFSDLHSNYYALKQFNNYLKEYDDHENIKLFFLGDLVGYYEFDFRIITIFHEMLNKYNLTLLLGNHDAKFLNMYFNTSYTVNCKINLSGKILYDHNMRHEIKELLQLSKLTEVSFIYNRKTIISHGGISDPLNDYYYPDLKFTETHNRIFDNDTDYIFGHTHHCFVYNDEQKNNRFINIGSLGMPRNKEVFGSILEITHKGIEIKKIAYNLDLQFEANVELPNKIKNRVYFGGNSKFIEESLEEFNQDEVNQFKLINTNVIYFKKLILIDNKTKVLKVKDGYLLIQEKLESKFRNLDFLKEIEYET
ncbi:metallophosphoesterase family protein [Paenibacillaceae bacterium WGS1546]|uniref:metallophosphoesterase family protein n=1 Tax=Cohnella sp. WGS1546 TaxID=3366810 RepID=UPI00372D2307